MEYHIVYEASNSIFQAASMHKIYIHTFNLISNWCAIINQMWFRIQIARLRGQLNVSQINS